MEEKGPPRQHPMSRRCRVMVVKKEIKEEKETRAVSCCAGAGAHLKDVDLGRRADLNIRYWLIAVIGAGRVTGQRAQRRRVQRRQRQGWKF